MTEPTIKVTRYREGDEVKECVRCGHVDYPENGGGDYAGDEWHCDTCIDTAPRGELPLTQRDTGTNQNSEGDE